MKRRVCFDFSAEASAMACVADGDFLLAHKSLVQDGMLATLFRGKKLSGLKTPTALSCLLEIGERTLRWCKLVEQIKMYELRDGLPMLNTRGVGVHENTIRTYLKRLCELGYVIRFEADGGKKVFYGLNLPNILNEIAGVVSKIEAHGRSSINRTKTVLALRDVFAKTAEFFRFLNKSAIKSFRIFKEELKSKVGGAVATLQEVTKEAAQKAATATTKWREKQAAKPFDRNPGAALEFWNNQAIMRKDVYPTYQPQVTARARGMMKTFLREQRESELDDAQVKERIEFFIENWRLVRNTAFRSDRTGGTRVIPVDPSFEFFFANRVEMQRVFDGLARSRQEIAAHEKMATPEQRSRKFAGYVPLR